MGGMIPQLPAALMSEPRAPRKFGGLLVPEVLDFSPPSPDSVDTARAT